MNATFGLGMSGSIRLFVSAPLHAGAAIPGSAAQAHYLGSVMRRQPGDAVCLFNGIDGEWLATITDLRRDRLGLRAEQSLRPQSGASDIWLLFAPLKRDATDLLVEKATELGVAALMPVFTERTNTARLNLDRLTAIATEAAEQCERLEVPRVHAPRPLAAVLSDWAPERPLLAALERSDAPGITPHAGPAALLIGPEGGFAPAELDVLATCPFVHAVSLGPLILRAETAAIVGLALLRAGRGG
jgi:16S rRNA (uracil1498-N3)-methyltransferase